MRARLRSTSKVLLGVGDPPGELFDAIRVLAHGRYALIPWHFLYFLPEPQGQGALRATFPPTAWGLPPALSPWFRDTRCGRGREGSSCLTSSTL